MSEFLDAVWMGLAAAAVLLAGHVALWARPWRLSRPAAYSVGLSIIGVAFTLWAASWGLEAAAVGFWIIAGIGGAAVIAAWWWRAVLQQIRDTSFLRGQLRGMTAENIAALDEGAPTDGESA